MINIICFMMRVIYQRASVAMGIKPGGLGGGGGGGGALGSSYAQMCVSKSEDHGTFFCFKGVKRVGIFHSKWV